ncbi:MAG: hypothetical protein RIG84_00285 [Roseovarius sp.]
MTRRTTITQTEIARTIKAAQAAGIEFESYSVNHATGEVKVFVKGQEAARGVAEIDKMLGIQ